MALITEWKYNVRKLAINLSLVVFFIWIVNSIIYRFTNINFSNKVYPFTVSVPVFFCFLLMSKLDIFKVLFSFITVCNFGMLTSYIGLLAFFFTGSFNLRVIFEFLGIILVIFVIIKFFRKPYFKILNTLNDGWVYLCAFPSLLSVIIYLLLYYPTEIKYWPENIPITLLTFILMFVFYMIVYKSFENISQYFQLKHNQEFIKMQSDLQKKKYEAIMDKVKTIEIFRHDMRHHITVVNTFLNDCNISEAKNYLNKLNHNLSNTIVEQYCENYIVNVILSSYISKTKEQNINVNCKAYIPQNIDFDHIELASVFANTLENAIIACKKIENPNEREITIICKKQSNQLYIQICNSFIGEIEFNGDFPISKNEGNGFGTRSIAAIAEKNNGLFSFRAEGGIFKTTVILNI